MTTSMDRRAFVKTAGVTSATLAMAGTTGLVCQQEALAAPVEVASDETAPAGERQLKYNTCPRNCHDTCSLISEVVDGKIVSITGDPTNPITAGAPCVKMNHYINWVNSPDRVLYPMKRTGAKGEGTFERITWDEAYATIAEKIQEAVDTYGPQAVLP